MRTQLGYAFIVAALATWSIHIQTAVAATAPAVSGPAATRAPAVQTPANAISIDEYFRLELSLTVSGDRTAQQNVIHFDDCPKKPIHQTLLTQIFGSDEQANLKIAIDEPTNQPLPAQNLHVELVPVSFHDTSGFFSLLSSSCETNILRLNYVSPIFFVREFHDQPLTVALTLTSSKKFNAAVIAATNSILSTVSQLAKIPAPYAPYVQVPSVVANAGDTVTQVDGTQLRVTGTFGNDGHAVYTLPAPWTWKFDDVYSAEPKTILVTAKFVRVPSIVDQPAQGAAWSPTVVENSALVIPTGACQGRNTVGQFLTCYLGPNLTNFLGSVDVSAAAAACNTVQNQMIQLGFSDRDTARMLWAITRMHPYAGRPDTAVQFDQMPCLTSAVWPALKADGIKPTPGATVASDATAQDMAFVATNGDRFPLFFKAPDWETRRSMAQGTFNYPVTFTDSTGAVFGPTTAQIQSTGDWLDLATHRPTSTRDGAYFESFGCFTYLTASAIAKDPDGLGKDLQGGGSRLLAFGRLPTGNTDVFMDFTFGGKNGDQTPLISRVDVSGAPTSAELSTMKSVWSGNSCSDKYRPKPLFRAHGVWRSSRHA